MKDNLMQEGIFKAIKGKVRFKEPLKKHTTFKIGGPARFFIEPKDTRDLKLLISYARVHKIPILVIGGGSNILVSDKGVGAMVLKLNAPSFKKVSFDNNYLTAGCAVPLKQLIRIAAKRCLSGVEFLVGIPGTLGGALIMNAGAGCENIGHLVEDVRVLDYRGEVKVLEKKQIRFGYRKSNLAKYIILGAKIKLRKKSKKQINGAIKRNLEYRRLTQERAFPNAGCIFKNPLRESAGQLIDSCGLKGTRCKDAFVSLRHANFILNRGQASSDDVLKLMELIKKRVRQKFNINLEPEIKIWQ